VHPNFSLHYHEYLSETHVFRTPKRRRGDSGFPIFIIIQRLVMKVDEKLIYISIASDRNAYWHVAVHLDRMDRVESLGITRLPI
jgi:hypothetical protein